MTAASSQAQAFYREVAAKGFVYTVCDAVGYPAPMTESGMRSQPFWSSRARAERVIKNVRAYASFSVEEQTWETFRDVTVADLVADGLLVGVNWSGPRATGYDLEPVLVVEYVERVRNPAQGGSNPDGGSK